MRYVANTSRSETGAAADPNCIRHCALTSTHRSSKPASSRATTFDDRRPTDLKKPCRLGRTLTKSSLFTACAPCGPAKTNDSPYCAAMAVGSDPPMFDSYWSKNALTRSLARCTAGSFHVARRLDQRASRPPPWTQFAILSFLSSAIDSGESLLSKSARLECPW